MNRTGDEMSEQLEHRKEIQNTGSVNIDVYKSYFKSVNNVFLVVIVGFMVIFGQTAVSFVDLFISKWYAIQLNAHCFTTYFITFFLSISGSIGKLI